MGLRDQRAWGVAVLPWPAIAGSGGKEWFGGVGVQLGGGGCVICGIKRGVFVRGGGLCGWVWVGLGCCLMSGMRRRLGEGSIVCCICIQSLVWCCGDLLILGVLAAAQGLVLGWNEDEIGQSLICLFVGREQKILHAFCLLGAGGIVES